MPLYEYSCTSCEKWFDRLASMSAADEQRCPACGSAKVRRLISVIAGTAGNAEAPPAPTCGGGACANC